MRRFLAAAAGIVISMVGSAGSAQTVYPIDRADILVAARFDFKVEFAGLADPTKVSVTVNGKDHPSFSARPPLLSSAKTPRINPP